MATEEDGHGPAPAQVASGPATRQGTAELALSLPGVRSVVLRLPPTVHGDGDHGFMATIVGTAREKGVSGYIGDGANRWPAVHRVDAAHLFRLAVENVPAGTTLHAVADEGVPIRDIAAVIGRHLGVPVVTIGPRGRGRALHLAGRLPRHGRPGVQHADPRADRLAADPARPHRGPGEGPLLGR